MVITYIVVLLLLISSAFIDVHQKRIPNVLCLIIIMLGLLANSFLPSGLGIEASMSGMLAGFLPMILLYNLTGLGAGDVKLMAALGSVVGIQSILVIFCYSFLLSGIAAIVYLIVKKGYSDILSRYGQMICSVFKGHMEYRKAATGTPAAFQMPLAPGITLAFIYVLTPGLISALHNETWWR